MKTGETIVVCNLKKEDAVEMFNVKSLEEVPDVELFRHA